MAVSSALALHTEPPGQGSSGSAYTTTARDGGAGPEVPVYGSVRATGREGREESRRGASG